MNSEIVVEVWGHLACFTRPECKVERLSYPAPTPSAARGILSAIYNKPNEFYWQVTKIEILNPIQYISFVRNEVKNKIRSGPNPEVIIVDETTKSAGNDRVGRTQRQTVMLKDVRYRIYAKIIKREGVPVTEEQLYEQAKRRIRTGKCFYQPSLGLRECVCYFEESDDSRQPINETMDLGYMLYDVFDFRNFTIDKKAKPSVSLFRAVVNNGVLYVPEIGSDDVLRSGGSNA